MDSRREASVRVDGRRSWRPEKVQGSRHRFYQPAAGRRGDARARATERDRSRREKEEGIQQTNRREIVERRRKSLDGDTGNRPMSKMEEDRAVSPSWTEVSFCVGVIAIFPSPPLEPAALIPCLSLS